MVSNELFGWCSVLGGVTLGVYMGQKFQREDWLGGYASFPRRMVRLAHVSLVALGMLNIQFAQSSGAVLLPASIKSAASLSLIAAAILMPTCCLWVAFRQIRFEIFAIPIFCLLTSLVITIGGLIQ